MAVDQDKTERRAGGNRDERKLGKLYYISLPHTLYSECGYLRSRRERNPLQVVGSPVLNG